MSLAFVLRLPLHCRDPVNRWYANGHRHACSCTGHNGTDPRWRNAWLCGYGLLRLLATWTRGFSPESARTVNPVQTTGFLGQKRGFCREAVDAGFPLQYSDLPHGRALSSAG